MGAQGGDLTRPCASLLRVFFDRVVDRVGGAAAHGGDREHHSADHQGVFIAVAGRIAFRQLHEVKINEHFDGKRGGEEAGEQPDDDNNAIAADRYPAGRWSHYARTTNTALDTNLNGLDLQFGKTLRIFRRHDLRCVWYGLAVDQTVPVNNLNPPLGYQSERQRIN